MRITDVLYNEKQAVFFLCLLQLFVSICTIGAAWQLSRVVCDVFLQNLSLNAAAPNIGLLLFFLLTRIILQYLLNNRLHSFASRLQLKIRKKLHRCLIMQAIPSDRLQLLAVETTDALDKISSSILPQLLSILVLMPLILILIFFTDLQSAVIVLVTLPIAPILLALIGHKTKSATLDQWRKLARLTASFRDMLAGIITIKIFRQEKTNGQRLMKNSRAFTDASMKVLRIAFMSSFALELITTLTIAILSVSIGLRLLYGETDFTTAFFLLLLLPEFYRPLRQGGTAFHAAADVSTARKALQETIDVSDVSSGQRTDDTLQIPPEITVQGLSFTYPGAPLPVLHNINLFFPAQNITCICGTSGIGKTTLLKLLAGLLPADNGCILFNDKNLAGFALESRQKIITYVPQMPHIFQGTLSDNISMFEHASDNVTKIKEILAYIGLSLPYNTVLGAGGQALSNGQCHRLGLARAFYQDRPVVLLDEPTAGLEPAEEQELLEKLSEFARRKTLIVISHRDAVRKWADREIQLEAVMSAPSVEVQYE